MSPGPSATPGETPSPRPIGGRYRLDREIGRGGLGVVMEAFDLQLKRKVAIKAILPHLVSEESLARFRIEAAAQARVRHANLVEVYDFGVEAGQPYLVMELLHGRDLESLLASGEIAPRDALAAVAGVARALARVHQTGIVHRDIKPENILIGDDGRARLGDFGIALDSRVRQRLTMQGGWIGTPAYMSPEQAYGEQEIGPASDVYALGALLFRVACGRPPYEGKPIQVLSKIQVGPPPSPREAAPRIDPEVEEIIRRAMAHDAGERYASAAAFAEDLERYVRGGAAEGRAHPIRWVLAGLLLLAALGSAGVGAARYVGRLRVHREAAETLAEARTTDDPARIVALADRVLALDPALVEALRLKGEALVALGRADEAHEALSRYLDARPGDAVARGARADASLARGDQPAAIEDLQRAAEVLGPRDPDLLLRLGRLAVAAGRADLAVETLGRIPAVRAADPEVPLLVAEAESLRAHPEEALAALWRAAAANPPPAMDYRIGRLAADLGDGDLALRHLERARASDPSLDTPDFRAQLARLAFPRRFGEPTLGGHFFVDGEDIVGEGPGTGSFDLAILPLSEDPGTSYDLVARIRIESGTPGAYAGFFFGGSNGIHIAYVFWNPADIGRPAEIPQDIWDRRLQAFADRFGPGPPTMARAAVVHGDQWHLMGSAVAPFDRSAWAEVRLSVRGPRFAIAVDGEAAMEVAHGHPLAGPCGLAKFYDTRARWRDVRLEPR